MTRNSTLILRGMLPSWKRWIQTKGLDVPLFESTQYKKSMHERWEGRLCGGGGCGEGGKPGVSIMMEIVNLFCQKT